MLIEGQPFIDAQDELSVTDFMRKYGMPERINEEVFVAMAKALDFIDPGAPFLQLLFDTCLTVFISLFFVSSR
jgi:hypothetical protein